MRVVIKDLGRTAAKQPRAVTGQTMPQWKRKSLALLEALVRDSNEFIVRCLLVEREKTVSVWSAI